MCVLLSQHLSRKLRQEGTLLRFAEATTLRGGHSLNLLSRKLHCQECTLQKILHFVDNS